MAILTVAALGEVGGARVAALRRTERGGRNEELAAEIDPEAVRPAAVGLEPEQIRGQGHHPGVGSFPIHLGPAAIAPIQTTDLLIGIRSDIRVGERQIGSKISLPERNRTVLVRLGGKQDVGVGPATNRRVIDRKRELLAKRGKDAGVRDGAVTKLEIRPAATAPVSVGPEISTR